MHTRSYPLPPNSSPAATSKRTRSLNPASAARCRRRHDRGLVVVEAGDRRLRERLGELDRRGAVTATDVGDAPTCLELGDDAVERRHPGRDELADVGGPEEALGAHEQVVVVLVPSDSFAGSEAGGQRVLVLVDRRGDGHATRQERRARLVGQACRLRFVEEERALRGVVVAVLAGGLRRQPFADVTRIAAGALGQCLRRRRSELDERPVEPELVAEDDGPRVQDRGEVAEEPPGELLDAPLSCPVSCRLLLSCLRSPLPRLPAGAGRSDDRRRTLQKPFRTHRRVLQGFCRVRCRG